MVAKQILTVGQQIMTSREGYTIGNDFSPGQYKCYKGIHSTYEQTCEHHLVLHVLTVDIVTDVSCGVAGSLQTVHSQTTKLHGYEMWQMVH